MVRLVDRGRAACLHGRPPVSRINGPPTVGLRAQRRLPEARAQREAASPPPRRLWQARLDHVPRL